jgi:RHS repeat-associated protein
MNKMTTYYVANASGAVVQELSYDAWGRLRNPATQQTYTPGNEPNLYLGRGYTGHEHLSWFGLINMNARLYDPALGRFLSPDPYVQNPLGSQNFNRYSYCLNNPFKYTDPSGKIVWFVPVIIGAVIDAYSGASIQSETAAFWDWKPDAWKGAIAGGIIGATLGYGVAGAIGATGYRQ